jgi:ketosteroid isomerase-like protein
MFPPVCDERDRPRRTDDRTPEKEHMMPTKPRAELARDLYEAFAAGDRVAVEALIDEDFSFSSPLDVDLDRGGYFARCWPGAGRRQEFDFVRLRETGDEVIVTYELIRSDGSRARNTEILSFRGERVRRAEVYFGWEVGAQPAS